MLASEVIVIKQLKSYLTAGTVFVLIAGTLSHFIYDWTGEHFLAGFFTPVSESVWEHMKLVFFPMLFFFLAVRGKLRNVSPCIDAAFSLGILFATLMIPVAFYTYSGILGTDLLILDLLTFALSTAAGFLCVWRCAQSCSVQSADSLLKILISFLFAAFIIFTYHPPHLALFASPV